MWGCQSNPSKIYEHWKRAMFPSLFISRLVIRRDLWFKSKRGKRRNICEVCFIDSMAEFYFLCSYFFFRKIIFYWKSEFICTGWLLDKTNSFWLGGGIAIDSKKKLRNKLYEIQMVLACSYKRLCKCWICDKIRVTLYKIIFDLY